MEGFSWGTLFATMAGIGAFSPIFIYMIKAVRSTAVTEEKVNQLEDEDKTIHRRIDSHKNEDKGIHSRLEDKLDDVNNRINALPEKIVDRILKLQRD